MMVTTKHIGRVGALAVALGVGLATAVPASATEVPPPKTALFVCGTTCPTLRDADIDLLMDQFIKPTHPGQTITPVAVTTPEEFWPIAGALRLIGSVTGDPRLFGPDGGAWPDEPLWKLTGLFDLTADQSGAAGADELEAAMIALGNDHLIVYGNSQGAGVVNTVKNRLAEQYPAGTTAPDIDFVLGSDPNLPNGGLASRFAGLYIPILDLSFNGAARTDTQFRTHSIIRQYDGGVDLPLYPINVVADLNAVMGFFYLHTRPFDVSLADGAPAPDVSTDPTGKNTYYFFHTQDLPLFAPLRQLGVPESLIDVVEPFVRAIVDMGYDRSIPSWEPTPARLIPPLNPVKPAAALLTAVGEGFHNAAALDGSPPPLNAPAPATFAAPTIAAARADLSAELSSDDTATSSTTVTDEDPPSSVKADTDTDTDKPSKKVKKSTKATSTADNAVESSTTKPEPSASASTLDPDKPAKPAGADAATGESDSAATSSAAPDNSKRGASDGESDGQSS